MDCISLLLSSNPKCEGAANCVSFYPQFIRSLRILLGIWLNIYVAVFSTCIHNDKDYLKIWVHLSTTSLSCGTCIAYYAQMPGLSRIGSSASQYFPYSFNFSQYSPPQSDLSIFTFLTNYLSTLFMNTLMMTSN